MSEQSKPSCLPPVAETRRPSFTLPENTCDAHCHVFGPKKQFPYSDSAKYWPPDAGKDALSRVHKVLGIKRAVLVQASCHGTDNRAMLDAIKTSGGNYRGVCIADETFSQSDFRKLHEGGVRGVRFNFVKHLGGAPDLNMMSRVLQKVAPLNWHLVIHVNSEDLVTYRHFFDAIDIPVVVDHMGRVPTQHGTDQQPFQILLEQLNKPNWWVKISGAERISPNPPFEDAIPFAKMLINAAPERILWGTDYPHPNIRVHMPNDGDLVDLAAQMAPDPILQTKILVKNPATLYEFE
ncbi:MAG: amidohydrolase family protein [Pseudomonadota bacterium]